MGNVVRRRTTIAGGLVPLTCLTLACGAAQRPLTGPALDRSAIDADLAATVDALESAYGSVTLHTPETWAAMRASLDALGEQRMDRRRLCERIGGVLTTLTDPHVFVSETPDGPRCLDPDRGTAGGYPRAGGSLGPNVAAGASAPYQVTAQGDVLVIGVRTFAPPEEPAWAALGAMPLDAPGVIVDLRGASGTDPRGFVPALERLIGQPLPPVLRAITRAEGETADRLRAAAHEAGMALRRDDAVWSALVGSETPPALAPNARPPRPMTVLVDGDCEEACQLVARALTTWAGAGIVGQLSSRTPLVTDDPALLALPHSGLFVHFDTTAYTPVEAIERWEGLALLWNTGEGESPDPMPQILASVAENVALRVALAHFAATPPAPCASLPSVATSESLSPDARMRLSGDIRPSEPQIFTATLALEPAEAQAWVAGCPGLVPHSAFRVGRDGPTLVLLERVTSFEPLSRLLAADVVLHVSIDYDPPVSID